MSLEQIDSLEAGPELDLLMAKEVMEYLILDVTPPCDHVNLPYVPHIAKFSDSPLNFHFHRPMNNEGKNYAWRMWQPSTDIADAWEVWGKMGFGILKLHMAGYEADESGLLAPTASLAICKAALKMMKG